MPLFNSLKSKPKIQGEIGYFGLTEWWLSEFSEDEQNYIIKTFQPLGSTGESLVKGEILSTSGTAMGLLSSLAGWFGKKEDRVIAYRMLKKAEELIDEKTDILDMHFFYQSKLEIYYRNRENDPNALEEAINACKKQIGIAPKVAVAFKKEYGDATLLSHKGFEQLAIIEEKQKNFEAAIDISQKALEQGWVGDWQKRIERCKKKLNKN
jgi:tetratricopeptide (TPR) repeat protein